MFTGHIPLRLLDKLHRQLSAARRKSLYPSLFLHRPEHSCFCMQGTEVKQEEKDKTDAKASKSEDKPVAKDTKDTEVKEEGDTDMKDAKDEAEGTEKEADTPKEVVKAKEEKQEEVKEKLPDKPFVQLHGKTENTGKSCCCCGHSMQIQFGALTSCCKANANDGPNRHNSDQKPWRKHYI